MIREHSAVFRSINGRRYLSKSAAIKADCRKLMERHYPTERPNYGSECPSDRYTHTPGWHFSESEECERIFARLLRFAKFFHGKRRTQAPSSRVLKDGEVAVAGSCVWERVTEGLSLWSSTCGHEWEFLDAGPEENEVKFCPFCGGRMEVDALRAQAKGEKDV